MPSGISGAITIVGEGKEMSDKDLLRTSHAIRGTTMVWWYEEEKGICVVGMVGQTVVIPWRSIRGALKRKDKK